VSALRVRGGTDVHGSPVSLDMVDGVLVERAEAGPVLDATGLVVVPGLVDLQVNGAGGVDLTRDPEGVWQVGAVLAAYGVTAFAPTIVTSGPEPRERLLDVLAAGPPEGYVGARPLGAHFEGPMLSPARTGAHAPSLVCPPSTDLVSGWSRDRGVLIVTLAPELPGALDVIRELVGRGVVVSIGHTDATADQARAGLAAGATTFTHLFNAMPAMSSRAPGVAGVALTGDVPVGVIADGLHLAPELLRLAWSALGPERFWAVSDTTALGVQPGPGSLGGRDVVVADGAVRLLDGGLAGSASSLADCLDVLRRTTGCSGADAVAAAATVPARLVGEVASLDVGSRGDLVLADVSDGGFRVVTTVVGGRVV